MFSSSPSPREICGVWFPVTRVECVQLFSDQAINVVAQDMKVIAWVFVFIKSFRPVQQRGFYHFQIFLSHQKVTL